MADGNKLPKRIISAVVFILLILIISSPKVYIEYAKEGLLLFAVSVLPASFPFFFFTKILTGVGFCDDMGRLLKKPVARIFRTSSASAFILFMSMLSGYPIGAKLTEISYKNGLIGGDEVYSVVAFTSTSGPIFILGTIGSGFLDSHLAGVIILLCNYLGGFLNGLVFRRQNPTDRGVFAATSSSDNLLGEAINSSVQSVLAVGGFITIFNMMVGVLYQTSAMDFLRVPSEPHERLPRA